MGQNQWCNFGVGAPPILVYFCGDWDVDWPPSLANRQDPKSASAPVLRGSAQAAPPPHQPGRPAARSPRRPIRGPPWTTQSHDTCLKRPMWTWVKIRYPHSEHPNPHKKRLKWVVHLPQNDTIYFNPQPCLITGSLSSLRLEHKSHSCAQAAMQMHPP